ncbi:ABC transporter permease [Bifidobacterium aemilianum]|uniref:ABC transporter permease n=1 Tax=Bifidobacterium aemilianum TaxID=2493120 RepID=A0A366KAJ8_9BIFI|nr:ECF transporter S component [Bifidobacterium aemilianum]RBP98377.1 ABC transporter permease [Bifidobacterium aemilianum]
MSEYSETHTSKRPAAAGSMRWRVVDIAVASVVGVASALIYWVAAIATAGPWPLLNAIVPGLPGLLNGLWLFAAPLALVIVCKPGAGLFAELVAGILEALLGNMWGGAETLLIALIQGAMAELPFLVGGYRRWSMPRTLVSGACAGLGCGLYSFFSHLQAIDLGGKYGILYVGGSIISGALVAGLLMWYLYLAIAKTGVLGAFASGRQVRV